MPEGRALIAEPLIHIGYHKTGTTWLQRQVFSDGERFSQVRPRTILDEAFVVVNPLDFDPTEASVLLEPMFKEAERLGNVPVISHERLSGAPLSSAFDAKMIADRLHATYPLGRVLIVFREQKATMLSIYKHHVLRSGRARIDQIWHARTTRERRRPVPELYVFEYHHLIRYYQDLFGADRVLALPFELLLEDSNAFVAAISRHVGVTPPSSVPVDRENVALPALTLAILRRVNGLQRRIGLGEVFSGPIADRPIRQRRLRAIRAIGRVPSRTISDGIERRWKAQITELTQERFAQSNKLTSELTGYDLGSYGYMV